MRWLQAFLFSLVLLLATNAVANAQSQEEFKKAIEKNANQLKNMKVGFQDDEPEDYINKDDTSIFVYNKEFAERFGLDPKKAEDLDKGLYAVELVIKKTKFFPMGSVQGYFQVKKMTPAKYQIIDNSIPAIEILFENAKEPLPMGFHYDCYLNLYVDSSLPILYPRDSKVGDGDNAYSIAHSAWLPVFKRQVNKEKPATDPNAEREGFLNSYLYKAFLSSMQFRKGKPIDDKFDGNPLVYDRYYKNLDYGINYISLGPILSCENLRKQYHPLLHEDTMIFLEKTNGKNYEDKGYVYDSKNNIDLGDFIYFRLPQTIVGSKKIKDAFHREEHMHD